MPRPRLHDENLRSQLLEHTGRMVTERGVDGLSLRALATQAGTSTTAVYSLFGGKSALIGALFEESSDSFGASQRAVHITGDVIADLMALGRAYWGWAREHPHLYGVMFSASLDCFDQTPQQVAKAQSTIEPLAGVVRSAVEAGVLAGEPLTITFSIWAAVHGVVSLVLAGRTPPEEATVSALFDAAAMACVRGWLDPSVRADWV